MMAARLVGEKGVQDPRSRMCRSTLGGGGSGARGCSLAK